MEGSGADSPINLTSEENDIFSALIEDEADNVKTDLNIHAEEYVPAIDLNNCTIEQFLSVVMKRKDLPKAQEGFIPIDQFIEKRIKEQNLEGYLPHVQRLTDKLILRVLKYLSVTRNSEPFPAVEVSKYLTSKPNILQYFENLGLSQDALTHEVFTLMRADKRLIYEQNYRNVAVFWLSELELEKVIARVQLAQPPLPPGPPPISSVLAATATASGGTAGAAAVGVSHSGSPSQPSIIASSRGQQQQTLPLPQQAPFHPVEPRAPASVSSQPLLPSPVELAQKFVLSVEGRTSKTFPFSAHEIFQFLVDLGANEPIPLTDVIIDFMCQDPRVIYDNTWMGTEQVFHGTELFCTELTKADNNSKEMFKKSRLHGMYHQTKQAAITMLTQLKNKTAFHVGHIQSIISKRTPVLSNDPNMQQSAKQDIITLSSSIFETMTKDVLTFLYDGSLTFRVPALGGGGVLIGGFYLANYASAQPESSHGKNTVAAALLAAKQQAKSAVVTKQSTEDSTTSTTTANPVVSTFVPVLPPLPATAISAKPFQPSGSKTPSPDPKTQAETDPKTQIETQAPAETDSKIETPTVTQPVTVIKTPAESEAQMHAETEQADAQGETPTETDTTAQVETRQAVPQGATELETVAVTETQTQSETAETVACVETESKAETQAVEALIEVDTDAVTEVVDAKFVTATESDSAVASDVSTKQNGDNGSDNVEMTEDEQEVADFTVLTAAVADVVEETTGSNVADEVTSRVTETVVDVIETEVTSEEVDAATDEETATTPTKSSTESTTTAAILSEIETLFYAHTASEVNDDDAVVSGDDTVDFDGAAVDVSLFGSEVLLNVDTVDDDGETLVSAKDEGEEADAVEVVAAQDTNTEVATETAEITLSASEDVTEPSEAAIVETAVESVVEQSETADDTVETTTAELTAVIDEPPNPSAVDVTVDPVITIASSVTGTDSEKDDNVSSEAEVPGEVQDEEVNESSTADDSEEVVETDVSTVVECIVTNGIVSEPAPAAVTRETFAVVGGSDVAGPVTSEVTATDAVVAVSENTVDASVVVSVDVVAVETQAASIPAVDDASVATTVVAVEPDAVSEPTVDALVDSTVVEPAASGDVTVSEPFAVDIAETVKGTL